MIKQTTINWPLIIAAACKEERKPLDRLLHCKQMSEFLPMAERILEGAFVLQGGVVESALYRLALEHCPVSVCIEAGIDQQIIDDAQIRVAA